MPGEEVQVRKEPVRGLRPLFMAAIATTALFLSSCAPVQLALDRLGNARNTTFKPTTSCPSIEGDKNNATFFLVENTTSFKIEGGLTFKGEAYTNGSYILCLMDNATNGFVLEKDGSLVAVVEKGNIGIYNIGTEGVFKRTNEGLENISQSEYLFGKRLGSFTTRRAGGVILSTPQINPTVLSQPRGQDNNERIDFIADNTEYSQPVLIIGGVVVILGMVLIAGAVIRKSREYDKANQERWSHGKSEISDIGYPNPDLIRKEPSPVYPFPPNQRRLPPIIINAEDDEPESLVEND